MKAGMEMRTKAGAELRAKMETGFRRTAAAALAAMLVVTSADVTVFAAGAQESTASETIGSENAAGGKTETELTADEATLSQNTADGAAIIENTANADTAKENGAEEQDNIDVDTATGQVTCAVSGCGGKYENGFCSKDDFHYEAAKDSNGDGYYEIGNGGQLYWFADRVNNDNANFRGAKAVLTTDITVNENVLVNRQLNSKNSSFRQWTPIGLAYAETRKNATPYGGEFDGRNFTISGLYYDGDSHSCVGLIGFMTDSGTVRNIGLVDSYFCVKGKAHPYESNKVGGIVGKFGGMENCTLTMSGCYNTGMIVGEDDSYVGGVVGHVPSYSDTTVTITNCYNTGVVKNNGYATGGVVGDSNATITGCYNSGTIEGKERVGGISGLSNRTILNCYNTGDITGNCCVGGLIGISSGQVSASYNTGTVKGVDVGNKTSKYIGGIAGRTLNVEISDCYNTGTVTGRIGVGGVIGQKYNEFPYNVTVLSGNYYRADCATIVDEGLEDGIGVDYEDTKLWDDEDCVTSAEKAQFVSGEIAYRMNGNTSEGELTWYQNIGTDASPRLTGQIVYYGYVSCSDTAGQVYTNDSKVMSEKPAHTYSGDCDAICNVCEGAREARTAHTYKSEITKEATTTATGVKTYTCSICGHTKTEEIPMKKPSKGNTPKDDPAQGEKEANLPKGTQSTLTDAGKEITAADTDKGDVKGSDFGTFRLKAAGKNKSVQLTWKKVKGADGYIIYGARCGTSLKKIKTIKKASTTKYTHKKLKKGKYYKYVVVAYKKVDGKSYAIATSRSAHAVTKGSKYGNPVKVSVKNSKITIKKGGKKTIKASYTLPKNKKAKIHIAKFRYESSNPKVATVSKKGVVKGKKKGTAYIYVYAQNGVYKKVKVTIK